MKFVSKMKFFGLALILGVAVCPVLIEKANADPVNQSSQGIGVTPYHSDVSEHDGAQVTQRVRSDVVSLDDTTEPEQGINITHNENEIS